MTPEQIKELNELSPEPLYGGREYFDNEELKQGLKHKGEQDAKRR